MKLIYSTITLLLLTACGSDNDNSLTSGPDNDPQPDPPIEVNMVAVGVYEGQSIVDDKDYIGSGAIINQDGEMRFIVGQTLLKAKLFQEGTNLTSTAISFGENGELRITGPLSGQFKDDQVTTSHSFNSIKTASSFQLKRSHTANFKTIEELSENVYEGTSHRGELTIAPVGSMEIDDATGENLPVKAGTFEVNHTNGCIYRGTIYTNNVDINVCDVNFDALNCGENDGYYTGLASYGVLDSTQPNPPVSIMLIADNGSYQFFEMYSEPVVTD